MLLLCVHNDNYPNIGYNDNSNYYNDNNITGLFNGYHTTTMMMSSSSSSSSSNVFDNYHPNSNVNNVNLNKVNDYNHNDIDSDSDIGIDIDIDANKSNDSKQQPREVDNWTTLMTDGTNAALHRPG